ncbi:CPBP family intramembrane metalloprotease [Halobaculum sp. CBA1158]|uniref:CPBP family intramembrane glutamic endopeptidase n=1 Tax=Halobaculum sp. CBA1158 TaxID=2904243 RepID=UPI001F1A62E2|nr:type II CAAX endopeptidase family protein [Halobaculum sp. CBA1158]UIO99570.1 CPBP family intramembrane metalloprotease [Halobaculum sp. CBA1158]
MAESVGRVRAWYHGLDPRAQAVLAAVGLGLAGVVVAAAVVNLVFLAVVLAGFSVSPLAQVALSLVFVQGISFGGLASIYLLRRGRSPLSLFSIPSLRDLAITVAGFVGSFVLLFGVGSILLAVGAEGAPNQTAELGAENPEVLLLLIPAAFVFIGPGEEILFRGVVQNRLREAFPARVAIPIASAIFGAVHYVALSGAPAARLVTVGSLTVITLVFGVTYEYTDNLVVPSLLHGAYDAVLFGLLYVVVAYGPGVDAEGGGGGTGTTGALVDVAIALPLG